MIPKEVGRRLKQAGLAWIPSQGDRFVLLDRDLDDRVFVINDMATMIELFQGLPAVTFHGTPEWALDYIYMSEAVWLPEEGQLRELLQQRLLAKGSDAYDLLYADGAFICRFEWQGQALAFSAANAAEAYAKALLHVLES